MRFITNYSTENLIYSHTPKKLSERIFKKSWWNYRRGRNENIVGDEQQNWTSVNFSVLHITALQVQDVPRKET